MIEHRKARGYRKGNTGMLCEIGTGQEQEMRTGNWTGTKLEMVYEDGIW